MNIILAHNHFSAPDIIKIFCLLQSFRLMILLVSLETKENGKYICGQKCINKDKICEKHSDCTIKKDNYTVSATVYALYLKKVKYTVSECIWVGALPTVSAI